LAPLWCVNVARLGGHIVPNAFGYRSTTALRCEAGHSSREDKVTEKWVTFPAVVLLALKIGTLPGHGPLSWSVSSDPIRCTALRVRPAGMHGQIRKVFEAQNLREDLRTPLSPGRSIVNFCRGPPRMTTDARMVEAHGRSTSNATIAVVARIQDEVLYVKSR
jgi:hypothetical protein